MDLFNNWVFSLYHGTSAQQTGPAPAYASDPTGIYVLIFGVVAVAGLLIYFHKKNQDEKPKSRKKRSSKRRTK